MKIIQFVFWFLSFALFVSCSAQETSIIKQKSDVKVCSLPYKVEIPNFFAQIDSSFLLITNNQDTLFQIINTDKGVMKKSGLRGKGPNEFINIVDVFNDRENRCLYIFDDGNRRISKIPYHSLINGNFDDITKMNMPKQSELFSQIATTREGVVYTPLSGKYFITFEDSDRKQKNVDYPDLFTKQYMGEQKGYAYYSSMSHCGANSRTVIALRYLPYFMIVENNRIIKTIQTRERFDEPLFRQKSLFPNPEAIIYYWQVILSHKHIFLLNAGVTQNEFQNGTIKTSIEVYDWDGNPVISIIPDFPIAFIEVDPVRKAIYGVSTKDFSKCISRLNIDSSTVELLFNTY